MTDANAANQYSHFLKQAAVPNPAAMIETFRAIGYGLETALADIIDNAITALAKKIYIQFSWDGSQSMIAIKDNGVGMSDAEIIEAMRPGAKNPTNVRSKNDLGRFGMGLKTASFSQCRKLTVISKKINQNIHYWSWDLDYVQTAQKWELLQIEPPNAFLVELNAMNSGTIVLWERMDRIVANTYRDEIADRARFLTAGDKVKQHLSMVFHRYLETDKIYLYFNGRKMEAWDPFLKGFKGGQVFAEEFLNNGQIKIKGYILPHKSKLSEDDYKKAEGVQGWNGQQGFYVYRNERMLLAGDWLGLFKKEEHYKLARIIIDISNIMDAEWQIDIKKSSAILPNGLKAVLKNYASKVRSRAVAVYRHKGKIIQNHFGQEEFHPLWQEKARHGKRFYEINRNHPLVKGVLDGTTVSKTDFQHILKFIEESVPIPLIAFKEMEQAETHSQHIQPFEEADHAPILIMMQKIYNNYISAGRTAEYAKCKILHLEPFNLYPQYIEQL
jgi:hypothetical protein